VVKTKATTGKESNDDSAIENVVLSSAGAGLSGFRLDRVGGDQL
jgi:hypothetical protein